MTLAHSYSSIKQFENCPQRFYRQRIVRDITDPGGEASKHGERIHTMFENRLKGAGLDPEIAKFDPICEAVIKSAEGGTLLVEHEMTLTQNLAPTGWWDDDAWLRSKLDVLIIKGGTATVIDWKTGKRNPDMFQMVLFAAQVFKHFPEVSRVNSTLVWLKDVRKDYETYSREASDQLWVEILTRIRRIYQARVTGVWPAKPSGLCNYCPAQSSCQWARR